MGCQDEESDCCDNKGFGEIMPARGALVGTLINTGEHYQDAVDNVHQLIVEHLPLLDCNGIPLLENKVVKYDEIKVYHTPFVSVFYSNASILEEKMNNCVYLEINVTLYYYFQSFSFGNDTHPFLHPLWRLTQLFLIHRSLYGFCNGTNRGVEILGSDFIGRQLASDTFLTGQVNLMVPVRTCSDDH